jgi:hypothetical protein
VPEGDGGGEGGQNPPEARPAVSSGQTPRRVRPRDIELALKYAGGSDLKLGIRIRLAAAALSIPEPEVRSYVEKTPAMVRIYGTIDDQAVPPDPVAPTTGDAMHRLPKDLPQMPGMSQEDVELALAISDADNRILREGLAKMGINDRTIAKLKGLEGLASSSGKFVAVALEKTHRMYFLQIVGLFEMADEMKEQYLVPKPDKDDPTKLIPPIFDDEIRAMYYRNYTEMVKQGGAGYKQIMEGTEALVRMIMAAKGGGNGKPKGQRKPGWDSSPIDLKKNGKA